MHVGRFGGWSSIQRRPSAWHRHTSCAAARLSLGCLGEARAFVCVCVLEGYSRKVMGENSEVFVPSKNHRSRLPQYRVTWVEPLATPTSSYSHAAFLTCSLCSGVSDAALSCKVAG